MGRLGAGLLALAVLGGLLIAAGHAGAAGAEDPVRARAHLRGGEPAGGVFFLPVPEEPGAVAVGAAHSFDRTRLAEAGEIELRTAEGELVARSRRYFARPGEAYHRPGATLRDDFVLFALEQAPRGVRVLEAADRRPDVGERVIIVGPAPSSEEGPKRGATRLEGEVAQSEPTALQVGLEQLVDLRGWGGAPVLAAESERVVGLLQSAWPHEGAMRLGVGPIDGVREALAHPFEEGIGRLFASLAPPPSAATSHASRRRAVAGTASGGLSPARQAAEIVAAATDRRRPVAGAKALSLEIEIEHPAPGSVVGQSATTFLAGRAAALRGGTRLLDVMLVVDTSRSTSRPTGVDVDGDGVVGKMATESPRAWSEAKSSDPGDSILAAEVAAARKLLGSLDPRVTRVGLVSFSQAVYNRRHGMQVRPAAIVEEPLTSDHGRVHVALERVAERGAGGGTHMAAGTDLATLELLGLEGALSAADADSEKVVLFFSDGVPSLPQPSDPAENVRAVLDAAARARRAGVRIHTFAIGPDALGGPIATVELAAITSGLFTPVREPGNLVRYMELVSFARVEDVQVENLRTGQAAHAVRLHADGSWDALVPLAPGENPIQVRARSELGQESTARIRVVHEPRSDARPPMPAELVARHNALLERRLEQLRSLRVEQMRKELVIEMERERAAALERAERQRKELDIEAWQAPRAQEP